MLYIFRLRILSRYTDEQQTFICGTCKQKTFRPGERMRTGNGSEKRFLRFGQATAGKMADVITAINISDKRQRWETLREQTVSAPK